MCPTPIIIVDGILTFHDERLRELFDIKIYTDADADKDHKCDTCAKVLGMGGFFVYWFVIKKKTFKELFSIFRKK